MALVVARSKGGGGGGEEDEETVNFFWWTNDSKSRLGPEAEERGSRFNSGGMILQSSL